MRSAPDPDKVLARTNRAAALGDLKHLPAWAELKKIAEERREEFFRGLARDLMRGAEVNQRQIDFTAGYYRGISDLLRAPEKAESEMRGALKRAERYLRREEGDTDWTR